jgi:hypothetical protein
MRRHSSLSLSLSLSRERETTEMANQQSRQVGDDFSPPSSGPLVIHARHPAASYPSSVYPYRGRNFLATRARNSRPRHIRVAISLAGSRGRGSERHPESWFSRNATCWDKGGRGWWRDRHEGREVHQVRVPYIFQMGMRERGRREAGGGSRGPRNTVGCRWRRRRRKQPPGGRRAGVAGRTE